MSNHTTLGTLYLLIAAVVLIGVLLTRRGSLMRLVAMTAAWTGVLAAGFVVFAFRDDLGYLGQRLHAEATGAPVKVGDRMMIPMAIDGHFWIDGSVNGEKVRFLIDSGATMTTIDRATARRAGIDVANMDEQLVRTGNGVIRVGSVTASSVSLGTIGRSDIGLHVSEQEEISVIGMNFLSTLDRWGVEGRWLVLEG